MVKNNIRQLTRDRWESKLKDCESSNVAVFKLAKSLKRKQISIPVLDTVAVSEMDKA